MNELYKLKLLDKLWGSEEWITNTELYCGKILNVNSGKTCSVHYHKLKDETFYVLEGRLAFMKNNNVFIISKGDVVHIPINTPHCFGAMGGDRAVILEISTQHFEDDSYRVTRSGMDFTYNDISSFEETIRKGLLENVCDLEV